MQYSVNLDKNEKNYILKLYFDLTRNHYAVGAPKGKDAKGTVYICHKCFTSDHISSRDITIRGGKTVSYGARFGQTLAAVNVDGQNNRNDELVVG